MVALFLLLGKEVPRVVEWEGWSHACMRACVRECACVHMCVHRASWSRACQQLTGSCWDCEDSLFSNDFWLLQSGFGGL